MACSAPGWRSGPPALRSTPLRGSAASTLSEATDAGKIMMSDEFDAPVPGMEEYSE
jgi:hypothetical protein